jgi:hypothetical protein
VRTAAGKGQRVKATFCNRENTIENESTAAARVNRRFASNLERGTTGASWAFVTERSVALTVTVAKQKRTAAALKMQRLGASSFGPAHIDVEVVERAAAGFWRNKE